MVKGKARAAGSFLGGLANNPAIVIIALVLGGLFIFRDRISEAFAGLGKIELPAINLPDINFPDFPEINFPDFPEIKFPDFTSLFSGFQEQLDQLFQNQQSILAGQTVPFGEDEVTIPPDTMVNPDGTVSSTTPPISTGGGATQQEQDFAVARAEAFDTLFNLDVLTGTQIQEAISNIEFGDFPALNALITSIQSLANFPELTPAQQFAQQNNSQGFFVPFNDPTGLGGGVNHLSAVLQHSDLGLLIR